MSRESRRAKAERDLEELERRYVARLSEFLEMCKAGTWGLFGTNDSVYERAGYQRLKSDERVEVFESAEEIDGVRSNLGLEPFHWHERFLAYSKRTRGENAPGEPKLAGEFLAELKDAGVLEVRA